MAESQSPHFAHWDSLGQEVKMFFEVGQRFKKLYPRDLGRQLLRFTQYVDMLNLFITKPVEQDDFPVHSECWLRPTLAAGLIGKSSVRLLPDLQRQVVPETLASSDLLVNLYWDLELDLFRWGVTEGPTDKTLRDLEQTRRKNCTVKLACSILQSCDWARHGVLEVRRGKPKAPPVVVVCHSKAMVLKLADTFNYLARYEYKMGYCGAEAVYGDAGVTPNQPVSVLVCTATRLQQDLAAGAVALSGVHLLVFTCQGSGISPESTALVQQVPATAQTMIFNSTRIASQKITQAASMILRRDPMVVIWEGESSLDIVVQEFVPEPGFTPAPRPQPKPQPKLTPASVPKPQAKPAVSIITPVNKAKPAATGWPAAARPAPGGTDLAGLDLHTALIPALRKYGMRSLNPTQKSYMKSMMTGEDHLFGMPVYSTLTFIIPTVHLMMNYPASDARTRVLVITTQKEEVDQIVADYLNVTTLLPASFAIAPEGIHSSRLTDYATPINYHASVIVGTTVKLAKSIEKGELDVSAVDTVVIVRGERIASVRSGPERDCAREVYNAVTRFKGVAPQLAVFTEVAQMPVVVPFANEISPGAKAVSGSTA
uniref:RNA helicase n=1 Tax=Eutreptiella gymnastica TaxID=73025 RepID=A0A7S1NAJ7_9EUGL